MATCTFTYLELAVTLTTTELLATIVAWILYSTLSTSLKTADFIYFPFAMVGECPVERGALFATENLIFSVKLSTAVTTCFHVVSILWSGW